MFTQLQLYINCHFNQRFSCSIYRIRDGLRHILSVSRLGNIHIQENKPWVLVKGSAEDRCAHNINLCNFVNLCMTMYSSVSTVVCIIR